MYPIATGNPFTVQQVVSGTGVFDGTEYGRAKGTLANADPNAVVRLSARLYGAAGNAYSVTLVDAGAGVAVAATTVTQLGSAISVHLRRSTVALLATSAEVAAAINAVFTGVAATYGGTGNGVVAAGSASLSGGVDAALRGPNGEQFLWFFPPNQAGGHFYFEQEETITVRQFEANFTIGAGTFTVTVARLPVNDNLEPIAAEAVPIFVYDALTSARPDIAFSDVGIILQPRMALRVTTSGGGLPGLVRFDVRKGARYPYL